VVSFWYAIFEHQTETKPKAMKHYYAEFVVAGTTQTERKFYMFRSRLALATHIQEYYGKCLYLKIEIA
jgi:hypothetical protein